MEAARPSTAGEEELQLQLALAMSKEEHDEDSKKRKADEIKYQLAIEQSKKEQDDEVRQQYLIYWLVTCLQRSRPQIECVVLNFNRIVNGSKFVSLVGMVLKYI